MNDIWDCVIIGAGPSGSAAAISCANAGFKVLLLDKSDFPRNKVCGCCLNEKSVSALSKLGLLKKITSQTSSRLTNLDLSIGSFNFNIPLAGNGIVISRYFLDEALINKAKEVGVTCLFSVKVKIGSLSNQLRSIELKNQTLLARSVIIATGLAAPKLFLDPTEQEKFQPIVSAKSYIGIGTKLANNSVTIKNDEIKMYVKKSGYVGFSKLEDGSIDLAGAIAMEGMKDAKSIAQTVLKIVPKDIINDFETFQSADWLGTPALTRKRNFEAANIYLIGDASQYVEPFTGEGIGWALESGIQIAKYLEDKKNGSIQNNVSWNRVLDQLIGQNISNCNIISKVLRYPITTSIILKSLFTFPGTKKYLSKLLSHGGEIKHFSESYNTEGLIQ